MNWLAQLAALVEKDLRLELRTKEMLSAMLVFAFLVVVIFAFAFNPVRQTTLDVFPGILWVAFSFAGMLGLNRSFTTEQQNETLLGLLLAPVDRTLIYLAKVITNLILLALVEVVALPLAVVLFDYPLVGEAILLLMLVVTLGSIGFVAVGTFLAALAANSRSSEMLLPLILFPVILPVLIAAVESTAAVLAGQELASFAGWLRLLAVYDLVFIVIGGILFELVVEV